MSLILVEGQKNKHAIKDLILVLLQITNKIEKVDVNERLSFIINELQNTEALHVEQRQEKGESKINVKFRNMTFVKGSPSVQINMKGVGKEEFGRVRRQLREINKKYI